MKEGNIVCLYSFFLIESVKYKKNTFVICLTCFRDYSKLNLCSLRYIVIAVRNCDKLLHMVLQSSEKHISETVLTQPGKRCLIIQM